MLFFKAAYILRFCPKSLLLSLPKVSIWASLVGQLVKKLPAMQETRV